MGFWWFMFGCNMLIPVMMIVIGRGMWKRCPKEINWLWGYRTSWSMKNRNTWKFAHKYCGRLWWGLGLILFLPSLAVQLPMIHGSEEEIGKVSLLLMAVQLFVMVASIFPTERALKRTFTDEGIRR